MKYKTNETVIYKHTRVVKITSVDGDNITVAEKGKKKHVNVNDLKRMS